MIELDEFDRHAVNKSVMKGLEEICKYFVINDNNSNVIKDSYEFIFPICQNSTATALDIEDQPITELKEFWRMIADTAGYEFDETEKYVLATDRGGPNDLLGRMLNMAYEVRNIKLASEVLEPLFSKFKQLG